jgi:alpha-tubulin suppressor-like RCC1 family protein
MIHLQTTIKRFLYIFFAILTTTWSKAQTGCWKSIYCESSSSIAIKDDGSLWAWGRNEACHLGNGNIIEQYAPVRIGNDTWLEASVSRFTAFAIKSDGTLWGWGRNYSPGTLGTGVSTFFNTCTMIQIGNENNWKHIQSDGNYAVAMKNDGTLWSWGINFAGELGHGDNAGCGTPIQIGNSSNWKQFDLGRSHVIALKNDNTLWAWGHNDLGQLGNGTNQNTNAPIQIGSQNDWKEIAASGASSNAIKNDGTLWIWGQYLLNYPTQHFIGLGTWKQAVAGYEYDSYGIKTDGTLWKMNLNNPFGNNINQFGTSNNWENFQPGLEYRFALNSNNDLLGWGRNDYGQLGSGDSVWYTTPNQISCDLLGISDSDTQESVVILSPNPMDENLFISNHLNEIKDIEIIDLLGKVVLYKNTVSESGKIDVSNLKKGIYLVKITFRDMTQNFKMVKN